MTNFTSVCHHHNNTVDSARMTNSAANWSFRLPLRHSKTIASEYFADLITIWEVEPIRHVFQIEKAKTG